MYALDTAKKQIVTSLKKALGKSFTPNVHMLLTPPKPEYGDLSFPCFDLAKGFQRSPVEIANELAAKMAPGGCIKRITAIGPYVNFLFDDETFAGQVFQDVRRRGGYGKSTTGEGKKILIEYANLNTHKEVHVGHLRNCAYGLSLVRLLRANGYEVTPVSYINDLGNNVARCLWGLVHLYPNIDPPAEDRLNFLGRVYAEAVAVIGDDPEKKAQVSAIQRALEDMEGDIVDFWKTTQAWSIDGLKKVFTELNLELAHMYVEHELVDETHDIVKRLLTDGIAKMSEGAVIVDLEEEKLGANLLRKSDGTLLYNAKDLALAYRKDDDYHVDRSLYVVDVRQSLALRQLAATLKRMGFSKEIVHLGYEFVTLPEGAMSSRKGNIVRWSEFRDSMIAHLRATTTERHPDWRKKSVETVARTLAEAAVKFGMLRQDPEKVITFDVDEAMSVEGFTGPYLLYSIARLWSLKKKAPVKARFLSTLEDVHERELVRLIARFPDAVHQAGVAYKPSIIAQYAFDLAKSFASYYEAVHILDDEDQSRMASRLMLCEGVRVTLEECVTLLGLQTLKEM